MRGRTSRRQGVQGVRRVARMGNAMRRLSAALAILGAALLCGCADVAMAPYRQPAVPGKAAWSQQPARPGSPSEVVTVDWWKEFRDPYLDALVGKSVNSNID